MGAAVEVLLVVDELVVLVLLVGDWLELELVDVLVELLVLVLDFAGPGAVVVGVPPLPQPVSSAVAASRPPARSLRSEWAMGHSLARHARRGPRPNAKGLEAGARW
ncbi:MAG: hypothetical protein M3016_10120 [Actinomycetota bacterium]|nr:hypothetical protein [Actinomycetota bacterium]